MGRIRFYGAVRNVTGSKHLLEWEGCRVLLDCGLVQGRRAESNAANRNLPFDPRSIDHVVLSHAHIDHSGALPVLVRQGFRGKIWCTPPTVDLLAIMLRDSATIQVSDADYLNRHRRHGEPAIEPLYGLEDAERVLPRLRGVEYRQPFELAEGVSCELFDAGHILGSAMVVLTLGRGERKVRVGFTGDHGRCGMPILRDPARLPEVDYLVTEATYGDRDHEPQPALEVQLGELVRTEQHDGGRLLIPAFAVGRAQNLIWVLGRLLAQGRIESLPVYVDSPMAREATEVTARHQQVWDGQTRRMLERGENPFHYDQVRYVRTVEESKGLNDVKQPCVIISASGMCESGRILHHLKRSVGRPEDCVLLVGFQAPHTLGRRLVEGQPRVRILGDEYDVRCRVRQIYGLSAHADRGELVQNLGHLAAVARATYVVHGEPAASFALRDLLVAKGFRDVVVPVEGEGYELA